MTRTDKPPAGSSLMWPETPEGYPAFVTWTEPSPMAEPEFFFGRQALTGLHPWSPLPYYVRTCLVSKEDLMPSK